MLYTQQDSQRELQESCTRLPQYRSEFRRDYARLIHSAAFRRLQGKTQIFPVEESDFFRNRLTHSLEVAQIAKTIALKLNFDVPFFQNQNAIDTDLVETLSLAHDLGHPPFGHTGELALHECMRKHGGFEGNAQSLRILSHLEKKTNQEIVDGSERKYGLNLTYRTLAGIIKYDYAIPQESNDVVKGYYESEAGLVSRIKQHLLPNYKSPPGHFKTLECQIMDIADDIAYSTYDTEDAFKGGFLNPLRMLAANDALVQAIFEKIPQGIVHSPQEVLVILQELFQNFLQSELETLPSNSPLAIATQIYKKSTELCNCAYARTELTSTLVDEFVSNVYVEIDHDNPLLSRVILAPNAMKKVEVLKHFTYEAVIQSPRLKIVAYRGAEMIKTIFKVLTDKEKNGIYLLPDDVKELYYQAKSESDRYRVVCDFISSMTDSYAIDFYTRLKSAGQYTIFKPF